MDLAKIRKKYQSPVTGAPPGAPRDSIAAAPALPLTEPAGQPAILPPVDFVESSAPEESMAGMVPAERVAYDSADYREPIEIIMAGRVAAGCGETASDEPESFAAVSGECPDYLCFRVSDEMYGINIMDIKEIIKPREVTEVPCAPPFVSGVISLRGTIIPIIDMRSRLMLLTGSATGRERVVVIKNNLSLSGLLVDEVTQVVHIDAEHIEPAPSVLEGVNREFVTGIGRCEGRFIIILNLDTVADIHLY